MVYGAEGEAGDGADAGRGHGQHGGQDQRQAVGHVFVWGAG